MKRGGLATLWFLLSLIMSVGNDSLTKLLQESLNHDRVVFWRFFFSSVILFPLLLKLGLKAIKTKYTTWHILRGLLLAIAISLWAKAIKLVSIATVTLMSFTIPLFTVLFAFIFLKEKISSASLIAVTLGFIGSIITLLDQNISFSLTSCLFLLASILFATLDIINKKLLNLGEKSFPLLFYSNLYSCLFLLIFSEPDFMQLSGNNFLLTFFLGLGANLILFTLLKAFSYKEASALAPLRYLELVISSGIGYFYFGENLSTNLLIGSFLVILSSIIITKKNV